MLIVFQISPITEDKVQLAKQNFPNETSELLQVSEFIDIQPSIPVNFRRAVTVKLPLPAGFDTEDESKVGFPSIFQQKGRFQPVYFARVLIQRKFDMQSFLQELSAFILLKT